MKFIESYKIALNKTCLMSKISSFLIAVLLFSEIGRNLYIYLYLFENQWTPENWERAFISVFFQLIIVSIFSLRFVLLWFKSSKFVWYSQIVWLGGWLAIMAYKLTTSKIYFGSFFGSRSDLCIDCFYYDTFLWTSSSLVVIFLAYLFFSPLKQIITLAASIFLQRQDAK